MKISSFATNQTKELEGVWVDGEEGAEFRIARMPNAKFNRHVQRLAAPYTRSLRTNSADPAVMEDIQARAASHHVLLGWKNVTDDDGKELEYSPDKAYDIFKKYPEFARYIYELAGNVALFKDQVEEDVKGN